MASFANPTSSDLVLYVNNGLQSAFENAHHPWRLPTLITQNEGRIVVLRYFNSEKGCWYFFTDRRTPKVSQLIESGGKAAATFYHPSDRSQLRLQGISRMVDEEQRSRFWSKLSAHQKSSYAASLTPGTIIDSADDGLSTTWKQGSPLAKEEKASFKNFCVYSFEIRQTDLLLLQKNGHRRCKWEGLDGKNFQWLVP